MPSRKISRSREDGAVLAAQLEVKPIRDRRSGPSSVGPPGDAVHGLLVPRRAPCPATTTPSATTEPSRLDQPRVGRPRTPRPRLVPDITASTARWPSLPVAPYLIAVVLGGRRGSRSKAYGQPSRAAARRARQQQGLARTRAHQPRLTMWARSRSSRPSRCSSDRTRGVLALIPARLVAQESRGDRSRRPPRRGPPTPRPPTRQGRRADDEASVCVDGDAHLAVSTIVSGHPPPA